MKKMIAFMFAAVAAVAFGEQQEEAPESWYTADGWNENFSVSRFNDGKKDYGLSAYYDKETKSVTTMWDKDSKPSAAIAFAAETAMIAQWNADKTADGLKTLANTIYNKAITKIEPNDNGGYKFYTSNGGGGNDYSGSIDIPKYSVKESSGQYYLTKDDVYVAGSSKWEAFVGADDESIESSNGGSASADTKVRIKGWKTQSAGAVKISHALENDNILANCEVLVRDQNKNMYYAPISKLDIIDYIHTNFVAKIQTGGEQGNKYYVFKRPDGQEIKVDGSGNMPVAHTYEVESGEEEGVFKCWLKDDDGEKQGDSWVPGHQVDISSIDTFIDGEETKLELAGWSEAESTGYDLAKRLTDGGDTSLIPVRGAAGVLEYVSIGKLAEDGCVEADEHSIHKHIEGSTTNLQVFGFASAMSGGVPYKAPAGSGEGETSSLAWLASDTEGALLVSDGTDKSPKFITTESTSRYYGTPKPAEGAAVGEITLGWHELPNVTTNYVEVDDATLKSQEGTDEETGETCKMISLYSAPTNRTINTQKDIYGAYMDDAGHLSWSMIVGASVAPTLGDFVTLTNSVVPIISGTTTNREERLHLRGFYEAADGAFLSRKSATEVEWKKVVADGADGIAVDNTTIKIENFGETPEKSLSDVAGNDDWAIIARHNGGTSASVSNEVKMLSIGSMRVKTDGSSITTNTDDTVTLVGYSTAANGAIPYRVNANGTNKLNWVASAQSNGSILKSNTDSGKPEWTHPGNYYSRYYGTGKGSTEVGWHPLPSESTISGYNDIAVEPGTASNATYIVKLANVEGLEGSWFSSVADGKLVATPIEPSVSNIIATTVTRQYITNEVNDLYVLCAGDNMTGDLWVKATVSANQLETDGLLIANNAEVSNAVRTASIICSGTISGNSGSFTNLSISAASFGNMSAGTASASTLSVTTLTVTATANLPTNGVKIGDAELSSYVATAASESAAEVVQNATNAMAQTWTVDTLNVNYTANLGAATTIDSKAAVLVDDPPEGQPKIKSMKIENDKLVIIDADGVSHYFTQDPIVP